MPASWIQKASNIDSKELFRKRPAGTEHNEAPQRKMPMDAVERMQDSKQSQDKVDPDDELDMSDISSDVGFQTPRSTDVPWRNMVRSGISRSNTHSRYLGSYRAAKKEPVNSANHSSRTQGRIGGSRRRSVDNTTRMHDLKDQQPLPHVASFPNDELVPGEYDDLANTWTSFESTPPNNGEKSSVTGKINELVSEAAILDNSFQVKRLLSNSNASSRTMTANVGVKRNGELEGRAMLTEKSPVFQDDKPAQARKGVPAEKSASADPKCVSLAESNDEFADSDLERTFVRLPSGILETSQTSPQEEQAGFANTPKLQWLPPRLYIPAKATSGLSSCQSAAIPASRPRPTSQGQETPKPFIRRAFPTITPDRSPIHGMQSTIVLRTCFRIGEAIRASAAARRANHDAVIELYARVLTSHRDPGPESCKQYLELGDLFTEKPPYLHGVYTLWKNAPLWDQSSQVFLGEEGRGKMCRVIGKMKKVDPATVSAKRDMVILSISETTWSAVKWVRGIVDA